MIVCRICCRTGQANVRWLDPCDDVSTGASYPSLHRMALVVVAVALVAGVVSPVVVPSRAEKEVSRRPRTGAAPRMKSQDARPHYHHPLPPHVVVDVEIAMVVMTVVAKMVVMLVEV